MQLCSSRLVLWAPWGKYSVVDWAGVSLEVVEIVQTSEAISNKLIASPKLVPKGFNPTPH